MKNNRTLTDKFNNVTSILEENRYFFEESHYPSLEHLIYIHLFSHTRLMSNVEIQVANASQTRDSIF